MSAPSRSRLEPEIARGLREVLAPVRQPACDPRDMAAARDVAHLLLLPGLEAFLAALAPHAGRPWPAELTPALDRLRRICALSAEHQTLAPFQQADDQLAGLAGQLDGMTWADEGGDEFGASVQVVTVADALAGFDLARAGMSEQAEAAQLAAPVAAALRAVLDWLAGEAAEARPLELGWAASTLEVTLRVVDGSALKQVHEVLGAVGGNVGPVSRNGADRDWAIRVPRLGDTPNYLMLVQGEVQIALPWHAVLRVSLTDEAANEEPAPSLPRLLPAGLPAQERPRVLVGWGFKRATLDADRIVWRLQATPDDTNEPAPAANLAGAVKTEDGERFWVADLDALMQPVPLSTVPALPPAAATPAPPAIQTLSVHDVQPLDVEAPPQPRTHTSSARRALVAEDSLTARMFLSRMLQAQGFEVRAVERASELRDELAAPWTMVCVDVELPDARGPRWIEEVVASQQGRPMPAAVVALVRDRADVAAAAMAGVHRVLQKPYDMDALVQMMERIGAASQRTP